MSYTPRKFSALPTGQFTGAAAMPSVRSMSSSSSSGSLRRAIELVDEGQNRQAMTPADLEQLARLVLDAVGRVDHHHDAVGGNQRAVGVFAEILVARRVEQRHAPPLELELERRRGDRDAALLLERHPVGGRVLARLASAHRAGQLDRAGVEQQLFGQRRLAGVRVRDDRERPPPRDFAFELGLQGNIEGHVDKFTVAWPIYCTPRWRSRHGRNTV